MIDVLVSEVGPRDGLQSIARAMPTEAKHRWIAALAAAGIREIEVGSFVSPKLLPQMADCGEVVRAAITIPGLTVLALAPNLKGAELAFAAGAHKVTMPVSASEAHSMANVRRTTAEAIEEVRKACALRDGLPAAHRPSVEAGISTAFGCTIEGPVPEDRVMRIAVAIAEAGADSVGLSDTTGYANPAQVKRMFLRLKSEIGEKAGGAHFHNTRGQGLANVVAALDAGVTTFDASQGGLGGCPYAPGATGNIVTEDLVFLLEVDGPSHRHRPRKADRRARRHRRSPAGRAALRQRSGSRAAEGVQLCGAAGMTGPLPLDGIRVVEFSHMIMGPSCGLILADLGADVVKIEPTPNGDNTRRLNGSGAGFFPTYNRNKRSIMLDLKAPEGLEVARKLVAGADVLVENFRPGALDRMGLGYDALAPSNERLIYCSLKGYLAGPYENRTALDEVVQMMGGLAYMTGPPGRPLRAGASVNDVMGGMFGAIAILAALQERARTGRGQLVRSSLFENNVFLMAQHMMQFAVTGQPAAPLPVRLAAWAVYDLFDTADGKQIFVGVVSDTQWRAFCDAFGLPELRDDPALKTNFDRVARRERLHAPHPRDFSRARTWRGAGQMRGGRPAVCAGGAAAGPVRRPAGQPARRDRRGHAARWARDQDARPADRFFRRTTRPAPRRAASGRAQRGSAGGARLGLDTPQMRGTEPVASWYRPSSGRRILKIKSGGPSCGARYFAHHPGGRLGPDSGEPFLLYD